MSLFVYELPLKRKGNDDDDDDDGDDDDDDADADANHDDDNGNAAHWQNKKRSNSHEVFDAALIIMIHNDNRIVVRSCLRRTDRSRYATTPTGALSHTPPPS